MDELDYLVLGEMLMDAQSSALQVAKKLGVSSFTVKSRYDKMVKEGIIRGAIVNIDLSRLGYQGKVFLFVTNLSNHPKENTIKVLKKTRNILVVSEIIGPYDILAVAPIIDFNDLKALVNLIKKIPSVQHVKIACINDTSFPLNPSYGKILNKISQQKIADQKNGKTNKTKTYTEYAINDAPEEEEIKLVTEKPRSNKKKTK
jgi:Lrp/AsnC family transcriptional regulator, regulator for asnA, asnC and gidA